MTKNFRNIKATLIIGVLMLSVFATFVVVSPGANAASTGLKFKPTLSLNVVGDSHKTCAPDRQATYTFEVIYERPAQFALVPMLDPTTIEFAIEGDDPDWVTAYFTRNQVDIYRGVAETVQLTVSITEEAPYTKLQALTISATSEEKSLWQEQKKSVSVSFTPDFLYFINAVSETNYITVNPPGSHSISVELTNRGSYPVMFDFEAVNVPEGWSVTPPNQVDVAAAQQGENKRVVMLTITPPYDFGYHEETVSFSVDVYARPYPLSAGNLTKVTTLNFGVLNIGFSASPSGAGILIILLVIIVIIVLILVFFVIMKKRK